MKLEILNVTDPMPNNFWDSNEYIKEERQRLTTSKDSNKR